MTLWGRLGASAPGRPQAAFCRFRGISTGMLIDLLIAAAIVLIAVVLGFATHHLLLLFIAVFAVVYLLSRHRYRSRSRGPY